MKPRNFGAIGRAVRRRLKRLAAEPLEQRLVLDSTVVFNEIMYNPAGADDQLEWIELHNQMSVNMDLSRWRLDGGVRYEIPDGTVIGGGEYLTIARDPDALEAATGLAGILGPYEGQLANDGEELLLVNNNDRWMDRVEYSDHDLWPIGPDGSGMSLAKRDPQSGSELAESWTVSTQRGGTPGATNFPTPGPPAADESTTLALSEIAGARDAMFRVELVNLDDQPVQLGRFSLVAEGGTGGRFVLPEQMLPPGEYVSFDEATLGFSASAGDRIFLYADNETRLVDAQRVTDRLLARSDENGGRWLFPVEPTFGAANRFDLTTDVVINEIMYRAPTKPSTQGRPPTFEVLPLVTFDSTWRFSKHFTFGGDDLPYDPGPDWQEAAHAVDVFNWFEGTGPFGFSSVLSARINTRLADPQLVTNFITTYYFEQEFGVTQQQIDQLDDLFVRHFVDDGAVVYLNGQEVDRINMPAGVPNANTLAASEVNRAVETDSSTVISKEHLVALPALNRLSVEVHQVSTASDDVVFGLELLGRELVDPGAASQPPIKSDEEWIELYNRGAAAVNLSGWKLSDAVDFDFPPGTELPPGGYLVIADNAAALSATHPETADRIIGNFSGRLGDGGERVLLIDAGGNPADEVHYYDDHPWPSAADGGGSSLELRDPWADNDAAEAWAASDESGKSQWQSVTYRAPGSEPPRAGNPRSFQEFIVGLLDAGEVLIDDLRVVEAPNGNATDLLQNGSFDADTVGESPAAWRIIGNHSGSVVVDPDDPTNHVLRLVATGATEHMHNHAETTLANGVRVSAGEDYEISFRAKWISGSPQLNTRLYFNRAAQTTILDIPEDHGTPGAPNSRHVNNIGPTYEGLQHQPVVPSAGEEVTVSVRANDPQDVASMVLHYAVERGDFIALPMQQSPNGQYVATIPGQSSRRTVQFYVEGTDTRGASSTFPAGGAASRALYRVASRQLGDDRVHSLRIIMTPADVTFMHTDSNVMSNDRLGATVIYNDSEVFYDVGIRLRASGYGRRGQLAGFNIRFSPDHKFRGVHRTIALDRGVVMSNGNGTGPVQGVTGASPHELLIYQIAHRAGFIPAMYDDVVYVEAPRSTNTGRALLKMTRYSNVFLDSQFENGGDGPLFKYELVYHATQTVDGNPESLKQGPNAVLATDIMDLGESKESYRMNFVLRNNRDADDFRRLVQLAQAFSLRGDELDAATQQVMDVDEWMRLMALHSLTGGADTYNMGLAHNLMLYVRPSDEKVLAFPWDVDHGFYYESTSPILGRGGSNLQKVIRLPHNTRRFYKHLLDLMETSYNVEYLSDWIGHYTDITGFNMSAFFTNYVTSRARFVQRQLESQAPRIPFEITTNGGNDLMVDSVVATLQGNGWIDVDEVRLQGSGDALDVKWTGQDSWQVVLPVQFGPNRFTLEAYNLRGELVGTDSITVTSSASSRPLEDFLRITEIMYNPAPATAAELTTNTSFDNDDFEYIELTNTSDNQILDLTGVRITDGPSEPFEFTASMEPLLMPGERILVVSDAEAFRTRYGAEYRIAGEYSGRLNNAGERIRMENPVGGAILDFQYGTDDPWPRRADGAGASLELIDPVSTPADQLGKFYRWRGSTAFGGSPGTADEPPAGVVINEVLASPDVTSGQVDSIELYNPTDRAVDVGGWFLSDSSDNFFKYQIGPGTSILPGRYLVIDESHFNPNRGSSAPTDFGLSGSQGDDVWLVIASGPGEVAEFVDDVHFSPSPIGQSIGRAPNGVGWLVPMTAVTLGGENTSARYGPVLIGEINFNPGEPSAEALALDPTISADNLEFIELYNASTDPIDLAEWRLRGGVDVEFDANTTIGPAETLLVLPFNPRAPANEMRLAAFRAHYGLSDGTTLVGGYAGRLSDNGERLRLERPDSSRLDDPSPLVRVTSDEVMYDVVAPWPMGAAGTPFSLSRSNVFALGDVPESWIAATPTPDTTNLFVPQAGDANLDRQFDQADIVFALAGAKYKSGRPASWRDGDWNLDGLFDQKDVVAALQTGNYRTGPYSVQSIAEAF